MEEEEREREEIVREGERKIQRKRKNK